MTKKTDEERIAEIYIADPALCIAAEVAMELGRPLLLTGEPGTGKTSFAHYLAERLAPKWIEECGRWGGTEPGPLPVYTFETKSTSVATDLFYRFDSLSRFQAAHDPSMSKLNRDYITFEALGTAILRTHAWDKVKDLVPQEDHHPDPKRAVVLVDEIDKAPRDFPNDLLNEVDRMFFRIPEVQTEGTREIRRVDAHRERWPFVVLTSNSEKNLPSPFLRRCVFHHISFPERAKKSVLKDIVAANLARAIGPLADDAIEFFYDAREKLKLDKPPTSAELVQWIQVMQARKWEGTSGDVRQRLLRDLPADQVDATLSALAKTADDITKVKDLLAQRRKG